jgi:hypothetical protein
VTRDITGFARKKQSRTPNADILASYFSEKLSIPKEESIELPDLPDEEFGSVVKTFRVKESQVRNVQNKLDENKSVGLDGISSGVLKRCADSLSKPITRLFQKITRSGIFPKA